MATLNIPYSGSITMTSRWTCGEKNAKDDWQIKTPSLSYATASFKYSFTSGTKIKSVTLWAKISRNLGVSVLDANGSSFTKSSSGKKGAVLKTTGISGSNTLNVKLRYRSAGKVFKDKETHSSSVVFSDIVLQIVYEGSVGKSTSSSSTKTSGFAVPPQSVCVYDPTSGNIYMFDGVTKVQHALSMDIQEEKNSDKDKKYVNNAKNEPDKLTIDVLMSDVYSGGGSILSSSGTTTAMQNAIEKTGASLIQGSGRTRSELAFYTLHWLKEQRRKLTVVTPQYVHTDMILSTVTVNHEDQTPFGWEGQLVFQHAYAAKKKKTTKKSSASDGDGNKTPALPTLIWQAINGRS